MLTRAAPTTDASPTVDHAWFRAGNEQPWHEVWRRDDLKLIARCGYERSWARSQQVRATTAPASPCPLCVPPVLPGTEARSDAL